MFANLSQQTRHLGAAHFLVRHFAAAMKNHGANLMAFAEKPDDLILANLKIMLRGGWPKLYFLKLRTTAALPLLVGFLALLVLKLTVVGNFANRRIRRRRNLHQIQAALARHAHRLERLHHAQLSTLFVNHPDFASSNPFIDADAVRLPEIPFDDKSP